MLAIVYRSNERNKTKTSPTHDVQKGKLVGWTKLRTRSPVASDPSRNRDPFAGITLHSGELAKQHVNIVFDLSHKKLLPTNTTRPTMA